jgi:hypothetical protein
MAQRLQDTEQHRWKHNHIRASIQANSEEIDMSSPLISNTVELLYLSLMLRWERTAPPDRHIGLLDGQLERNTQAARFAFVLRTIGAGCEARFYRALAVHLRRNDGESYVSKDPSWMTEPVSLAQGWYFEGCTSLSQKQSFAQKLTKLGLSATIVACIYDFVSGNSVKGYVPTEEQQAELIRELERKGELDSFVSLD